MRIVTWNVHTITNNTKIALQYGDSHNIDVIAIQEPGRLGNNDVPGTASGRYHKLWAGTANSQSVVYIHKRIPQSSWDCHALPNAIRITFYWRRPLVIYAIYNPPQRSPHRNAGPFESTLLAHRPPQDYEVILMGDTNLSHPDWDQYGRRTPGVNSLITLTEEWGLTLRTPYGTTTRHPTGVRVNTDRSSTIDHIWATPTLQTTYEQYDWPGSDHVPQGCTFTTSPTPQTYRGYSWARMNAEAVARLSSHLFAIPPSIATTITELEEQTNQLITKLDGIARASTPAKGPPHGYRYPGWNHATEQATSLLRQAEQRHRREGHTEETGQAVRTARQAQRRALRQASTTH